MASTYVNDLRLNEMATGDESGNWGVVTNTNLELIGEALGYGTEGITTNADTHTSTIADGATDPARAMYIKYTGTLDSACTITIAPNTVNRMHFIENGTTGSQNIIISQGTGANITIPAGDTKAVYLDGAGAGAAVTDAFASFSTVDLKVQDDLTVSDDLTFDSDSAVITFGADGDTTLTHTDGTGLTLNSTNKICFNDASQFIQGSSATVLSLGATDEIDLTATAIDINGTLDVSGQATFSDGSAGAPSISNTGDANAGLYFSAADTLAFSAGGTGQFTMADGAISPVTDNDIDLGTASLKYKNFYAALVDGENFKVNGAQGSDGQLLTSTGSGVAWEDAPASGPTFKTFGTNSIMVGDNATGTISGADKNTALGIDMFAALTTGDNNVAVGFETLKANTTGSDNTALGYSALLTNTTESKNTAVGFQALYTNVGESNTALGHNALFNNTTGDYNVAIGRNALTNNTTASNNTAIGTSSLDASTTGDHNVGIGAVTLGALTGTYHNNVAIGRDALTSSTVNSENVAIGAYSMDATDSTSSTQCTAVGTSTMSAALAGYGNTAIGHSAINAGTSTFESTGVGRDALKVLTSGDYNTGIGSKSLVANTTGYGQTALGYNAGLTATTGAGNVFIGNDAGGGTNGVTTGIGNTFVGYQTESAGANGNYQIVLGFDCLSVNESTYFTFGRGTGNNRVYNNYDSNASWTRVSDVRYKEEIQNNTDCGLDFINDLRPVTFKWKAKSDIDSSLPDYNPEETERENDTTMYGLIAQEVKEAMDKHGLVDFGGWDIENSTGIQGVSQEMFIHPLIKAVQELSAKVEELEKKLN